jgi:hypothetical protein
MRPFPTPALDAWHAELAARERTRDTFDALWRAACAEAHALDFATFPSIARGFRLDAARILRDAASRQGRRDPV